MARLFTPLKRILEVLRVQFKNNYVREAVYRANFITVFATDLIWCLIEMAFFKVIYSATPILGGWNEAQTFFFLGVFFASDALFSIFFQRNFWNFGDLVTRGELDILLTKPVPASLLAMTRWINLTGFLNFFLGLGIIFYYSGPAGFAGGWHWLLVLFWLGVGLLSALMIRFLFSVWVFWTERGFALSMLYYQLFTLANKPDALYPKVIRYLLLSIIPFAFIGSVPARALLEGLTTAETLGVFLVLGVFATVNTMLWKAGLKRYQSASS